MSVVAVVNRKGGTGKSTLAVHLAAYCARQQRPVLLGDTDPNQSTQVWLRLRALRLAQAGGEISARAVDPRNALRPPAGTHHVVLDTEGGLLGFELSRTVNQADVVLIPVCHALFDREAAAACWAELRTHPRVTSGRCRVAAVGMRVQGGAQAEARLRQWAAAQDLPFIGALRDNHCYAHCVERGLTLFDLPPQKLATDLAQWAPIIDWLGPLWLDKPVSPVRQSARSEDPRIHRPLDRGFGPQRRPAERRRARPGAAHVAAVRRGAGLAGLGLANDPGQWLDAGLGARRAARRSRPIGTRCSAGLAGPSGAGAGRTASLAPGGDPAPGLTQPRRRSGRANAGFLGANARSSGTHCGLPRCGAACASCPIDGMNTLSRRVTLLLNLAHAVDHLFLLIFATAVSAIAAEFGFARWEDLMPYSVGAFFMFGLASLPAGRLGDLWGRRPMMLVFFHGMGVSALLAAATQNAWQMAAALTLLGSFAAIYHPVGIPMLVQGAAKPGATIGINGLAGNLGIAVAALLTGVLVQWLGWRAAFALPGLACIGLGIVFARHAPAETEPPAKRGRPAAVQLAPGALARMLVVMTVASATASLLFNLSTNGNGQLLPSA